jgi:hypothetical protein
MPKTPKTALKQMNIPFEVHPSGDPWQLSGEIPATVPLPNDVIITEIEGAYRGPVEEPPKVFVLSYVV